MITVQTYVFLSLFFYLFWGAAWYVMDRTFGVKLYRRYYNFTHKDPLPEGEVKGFIYNRTTRAKSFAAVICSTILSVLAILSMEFNLLVEITLWIVEIPIIMAGFYLGHFFGFKLWSNRNKGFEMIDRLERGDVHIGEQIAEKAKKVVEEIQEEVSEQASRMEEKAGEFFSGAEEKSVGEEGSGEPEKESPNPAEEEPVKKKPEELDPYELVDRFTDKKKRR